MFSRNSKISDVIKNPNFKDFGHLLFPTDHSYYSGTTLKDLNLTFYSNIQPDKTVEIINTLYNYSKNNIQIFFRIYSEKEIQNNPKLNDVGLFFFPGKPYEKFAICNAGGAFRFVGAIHDSFPHCLELSKKGYNAFALIYRVNNPYEDLAKSIEFLYDNSEKLKINKNNYSLWGGSAGARMAAVCGNKKYLFDLTKRKDIPQCSSIIMQYTGYNDFNKYDGNTFVCVGKNDWIANWKIMENRLKNLQKFGIKTEFHAYDGLDHGFGLGTGTIADGWIDYAIKFWENNINN